VLTTALSGGTFLCSTELFWLGPRIAATLLLLFGRIFSLVDIYRFTCINSADLFGIAEGEARARARAWTWTRTWMCSEEARALPLFCTTQARSQGAMKSSQDLLQEGLISRGTASWAVVACRGLSSMWRRRCRCRCCRVKAQYHSRMDSVH
jgi:hypothetical protein